jgi:hypothetical protein
MTLYVDLYAMTYAEIENTNIFITHLLMLLYCIQLHTPAHTSQNEAFL